MGRRNGGERKILFYEKKFFNVVRDEFEAQTKAWEMLMEQYGVYLEEV